MSGFYLMLFIANWTTKWLFSLVEGCRGARCRAKLMMSPVQRCIPHMHRADKARGDGDTCPCHGLEWASPRTSAAQLLGDCLASLNISIPHFKMTLKNVNGRERDTSARKTQLSSHIPAPEAFGRWGNGLEAKPPNPFQARPQRCTHPH